MTEREITEEIRIARLSSLVALGVSIVNIVTIMIFSLLILGTGVIK